MAENLLTSLPSCAVPEVARLARTLRRWKTRFLAYFTTARASNGGTKPYQLPARRILVGGGLAHPDLR